jgi:integrase
MSGRISANVTLFAFYHRAAYTGARRGELLNLRWRDIDLDLNLGEVRITDSAAVIAGQRIEGTTKSGRSRTVSIDAETAQVLRDHRKRQAVEQLRVGPKRRSTDDLRHIDATTVYRLPAGVPVHVVAARLGRSAPLDHAARVRPHDQRPARRGSGHLCPRDRLRWLAAVSTRVVKSPFHRWEGPLTWARSEGLEPPTF